MPVEPAWSDYYRDEMDAAWLYRTLARTESDPQRRTIFENLATVEDEHVERWRALFQEHGGRVPAHAPSLRSRVLAAVAGVFGSSAVLPLIVAEESREVGSNPPSTRSTCRRRSAAKASPGTVMRPAGTSGALSMASTTG